jgi:hypothetical protein
MWFETPVNFILDKVAVECSLNGQQYTDDESTYYYYRPPLIYNAQPRKGPITGGTAVSIDSNNVPDNLDARCTFGNITVPAKKIGNSKFECKSPPV